MKETSVVHSDPNILGGTPVFAGTRVPVQALIDYIEGVMPASGHLVDDRLTLADIAVASPFVNFAHCGVNVDKAKHPKTAAFIEAMLARPSFAPWVEQEKAFLARPARAPA